MEELSMDTDRTARAGDEPDWGFESYEPTAADWAEYQEWAALPWEPSAADAAWNDGYMCGRSGLEGIVCALVGTLRDAWEQGYAEGQRAASRARQDEAARRTGRAIDQAGGIGPFLHREAERRLGLPPLAGE
jgi:hypothetical protein